MTSMSVAGMCEETYVTHEERRVSGPAMSGHSRLTSGRAPRTDGHVENRGVLYFLAAPRCQLVWTRSCALPRSHLLSRITASVLHTCPVACQLPAIELDGFDYAPAQRLCEAPFGRCMEGTGDLHAFLRDRGDLVLDPSVRLETQAEANEVRRTLLRLRASR